MNADVIASGWSVGHAQTDADDTEAILTLIDREIFALQNKRNATLSSEETAALDRKLAEKLAARQSAGADTAKASTTMATRNVYSDLGTAAFITPRSTEAMLVVAGYSPKGSAEDALRDTHVFSTCKGGLYKVSFAVHSNVRALSKIKKDVYSLGMSNLHFPVSSLKLSVSVAPAAANASSAVHDFSTTPSGHHTVTSRATSVDVNVKLPPSKTFEMKWRMLGSADAKAEESAAQGKREQQAGGGGNTTRNTRKVETAPITVRHEALHSIEEGNLVQSVHYIKYNLDKEQTSFTETTVRIYPRDARVSGVSAHGLNAWNVKPAAGSDDFTTLHLSFNGALSEAILLRVHVELDFTSSVERGDAQQLAVPKLVCMNVLRQSGFYAISKASSIEVHEASLPRGFYKMGIDELSESLRFRAASGPPLVLAYKYMSAAALTDGKGKEAASLMLSVRAHQQMAILDAIVENAHYDVGIMANGRSVHKLLMTVQNTKEQYLRITQLPLSTKVWSLMVNSVTVKPVMLTRPASEGAGILIPLLVGLPSDLSTKGGNVPKTSVELVYVSENGFLADERVSSYSTPSHPVRVMEASAPFIEDLPIQVLTVKVQFPEEYLSVFSPAPRTKDALEREVEKGHITEGMRTVLLKSAQCGSADITGPLPNGFSVSIPKPISHRKGRKVVPADYVFQEGEGQDDRDVEGQGSAGLKIDFKAGGRIYRFQRSLLEGAQARLQVFYEEKVEEVKKPAPPKKTWEKVQDYILKFF